MMTRFLQKAVAVSALCAFAWLGACSDEPAGPGSQDSASPNLDGPIVSDAVSAAQATVRAASGSALASAEGEVAYVALPPGTEPSGSQAILRRVGDATSLTAQVIDGGFDPVPVPAEAGDSVEILVTDVGGATLLQIRIAVLPRRPPIIVRTDPPRDKTDVPLNSLIVVVFNEPVDTGSVTSSSVQLFRGATPIAGGARLLQGTRTAAVFEPSSSLDPNTEYELVVTNEVRDFDGDALAASVSVAFTTGSTLLGSVSSVRVRPDSLVLPVGQQFQLTATAHDEQQNVIVGHPVVWSSSDPLIATVSAAGLVTGIAEGGVQIEAQVDGHTGSVGIRVSEGARPIGAVTITPDSTGVDVGQDVILRAELRDTAGAIIDENRPVTWTSLNPAVATVTSDVPRAATVTGVAEGIAQIVATAEGKADTALVSVPAGEGGSGTGAEIQVTAVTTGVDLPEGHYVWAWAGTSTSGDMPIGRRVPANGTLTISDLSPGEYRVGIGDNPLTGIVGGMALNCDPIGPALHQITLVDFAAVSFDVVCGPLGELAFADTVDGNDEIYVINSNGTGRLRLTSHPASDVEPAWSPDGGRIAFASDRDGNAEIYVMNADGSNPVRLTDDAAEDRAPAWSPDGSRIAFHSLRDGDSEIYVMNADGTNPVNLTNHGGRDSDPAWSPDGTMIAFVSDRHGGNSAIYIMNGDGSAVSQLTYPQDNEDDGQPTWSPDGSRMAFSHAFPADGCACQSIAVMNADGSDLVLLPAGIFGARHPTWYPDGRHVAAVVRDWEYGGPDYIGVVAWQGAAYLTYGFDPAWRW